MHWSMNGKCFKFTTKYYKLCNQALIIRENVLSKNDILSSFQVLSCLRAVSYYPAALMGGHCWAPRPLKSVGSEFSWRCRHFGSSLTSWARRWLLLSLEGDKSFRSSHTSSSSVFLNFSFNNPFFFRILEPQADVSNISGENLWDGSCCWICSADGLYSHWRQTVQVRHNLEEIVIANPIE